MAVRTLKQTIKELELHVKCAYVGDLACDVLDYLKEYRSMKDKSDEDIKYEEPPLGNPPDFVPLDFRRLSEMIGQPVYIKDHGCKGHWEILTAVRKNLDGEDFTVRGNERWQRIGNCIYRTKEGAYEDS